MCVRSVEVQEKENCWLMLQQEAEKHCLVDLN